MRLDETLSVTLWIAESSEAIHPMRLTKLGRNGVVPVPYMYLCIPPNILIDTVYRTVPYILRGTVLGPMTPLNVFCHSKLPATSNAADVDCTRFRPTPTPLLPSPSTALT